MNKQPSKITRFIKSFNEYDDNRKVISYDAMRISIGILGMALPFILIIGSAVFYSCCWLPPSISQYYHTEMRDFFVGILAFVSMFLIAYRGYNILDHIAGIVAGIGALGVALFPALIITHEPGCIDGCVPSAPWKLTVHIISASVFFITLALMSIFLFTQTGKEENYVKTKRKIIRNKIYRVCGILIILSLIMIIIYKKLLFGHFPKFDKIEPVFWLETTALISFGVSWLVKGKAVLRDK